MFDLAGERGSGTECNVGAGLFCRKLLKIEKS